MAKVPGGLPEAERSRINMEELLRKTRKVFLLHSVVSLLLLVPYFTFLEVFLHQTPDNYQASSALLSRPLTHSLPLLLLLLSFLSNLVYLHHAKLGRDAARAWNSLASPPSPRPVSPACAPSLTPPPSPSRPMNAGDVLSAHISRGGGPPTPRSPPPPPSPGLPSPPAFSSPPRGVFHPPTPTWKPTLWSPRLRHLCLSTTGICFHLNSDKTEVQDDDTGHLHRCSGDLSGDLSAVPETICRKNRANPATEALWSQERDRNPKLTTWPPLWRGVRL